ncbi:unnamed protein product [Caenorhabditis angaria]|uniref:Uncharacterized protein n=1 Tax=Caenorhabditis angaria TaxID=860376 RepID=A0A9P1IB00_9PELO|nr:unnamed protein product [Caenorhabditis angaria]
MLTQRGIFRNGRAAFSMLFFAKKYEFNRSIVNTAELVIGGEVLCMDPFVLAGISNGWRDEISNNLNFSRNIAGFEPHEVMLFLKFASAYGNVKAQSIDIQKISDFARLIQSSSLLHKIETSIFQSNVKLAKKFVFISQLGGESAYTMPRTTQKFRSHLENMKAINHIRW